MSHDVIFAHLIPQQRGALFVFFVIRVDGIIQLIVVHRWALYVTLHPATEALYVNAPEKIKQNHYFTLMK